MGIEFTRVDAEATAVGRREVGFDLNITAAWPPSDPHAEEHRAWVREVWESLKPHSTGVYTSSCLMKERRVSRRHSEIDWEGSQRSRTDTIPTISSE
jgi:hypothetical protein